MRQWNRLLRSCVCHIPRSVNCSKCLHFTLLISNEKVPIYRDTESLISLKKFNESWGSAEEMCRGWSVQNSLWGPLFCGMKPMMRKSESAGQHLTNAWHRERSRGGVWISGSPSPDFPRENPKAPWFGHILLKQEGLLKSITASKSTGISSPPLTYQKP